MRLLCLLCALLLSACVTVDPKAEQKALQPKLQPVFEALNNEKNQRAIFELQSGSNQALEAVLTDPNSYEPPVLFALAQQLYNHGEITPALFWFYTAQLRARSDANKSQDPTTQQGVTQLSGQYGAEVNRYGLTHLDELKSTINHVLAWDAQSARYYNPRWVALSGADAYTKQEIAFKPQEQWRKIDEETRNGFQQGFEQLLRKFNRLD